MRVTSSQKVSANEIYLFRKKAEVTWRASRSVAGVSGSCACTINRLIDNSFSLLARRWHPFTAGNKNERDEEKVSI
jgi:hypothetical protein